MCVKKARLTPCFLTHFSVFDTPVHSEWIAYQQLEKNMIMILKYNFVETPCKFIIAKLSSVLIILLWNNNSTKLYFNLIFTIQTYKAKLYIDKQGMPTYYDHHVFRLKKFYAIRSKTTGSQYRKLSLMLIRTEMVIYRERNCENYWKDIVSL